MADTGPAEPTPAVVVGAGGLLGGAVVRELRARGRAVRTARVHWGTAQATGDLAEVARSLPSEGAEVYWCAGAGVVATTQDDLDVEVAALQSFVDHWDADGSDHRLFLASSAGGVYAGATGSPFTEETEPAPLAPYGQAKLDGEVVVQRWAGRTGSTVLIGRFSNLYGPGQDMTKPQGLISQLCRSSLVRSPLNIYVSADTIRDYLYVDDAARMAVEGLDVARTRGGAHTKILASEQPASIAAVIGSLNKVTRRRAPVVFGASPNARFQVADLRFRSTAWPSLRHLASTPLVVGVSATLDAVARQLNEPSEMRD